MPNYIKALTITQPYATLIAIKAKRFETRSWSTSYRGPLAIHAATTLAGVGGKRAYKELCTQEPFRSVLNEYSAQLDINDLTKLLLPRGVVVAVANLVTCVYIPPLPNHVVDSKTRRQVEQIAQKYGVPPEEPELSFGDYTPGRYVWVLENVRALDDPVFTAGKQSLWDWTIPDSIKLVI